MPYLARALTITFVTFACAGACSTTEPRALSEGCLVNTDCAAPLVCAFRKCHVECSSSRDCDPGQLCVASDRPYHVCQLESERLCAYNSDCPIGQSCAVDLQCRDQCLASRDCLKDQTCVAGSCAEQAELSDGKLMSKRSDDAGSGQPCLYTSQCPAPLFCRNNLCSSECLAASDCSSGLDCVNNRCVAGSGTLIGASGGVVAGSGGKVRLTIPPNAVRAPVSILILPVDAWPDGALGRVYQIEPNGLEFLTPATLTFAYLPGEIAPYQPSELRVAQAIGSTWSPLATSLHAESNTVSSELAHLSVYGVIHPIAIDAGASAVPVTPDASVVTTESATDASSDGAAPANGDAALERRDASDAAIRGAAGNGDAAF